MKRLSSNLIPIYNLELSEGNKVIRINEPAGTKCPLAIIFEYPLHFDVIADKLTLSPAVRRWENIDQHYPLEAGFVCDVTGHVLSGPSKSIKQ